MYCYEKIARLFMDHHKISYNNDTSFFINSKGSTIKSYDLDFSDFALIVGIPFATSHIGRKMFSKYMVALRSILCREAYEYYMTHKDTTREAR